MSTVTLKEVLETVTNSTPYNKSLKVRVIASGGVHSYTNEQGEERQCINIAVADNTRAAKAVVYDNTKFRRFMEGCSVLLRNIITKPEGLIVVTSNTKVYPTQHVDVSDIIRNQAEAIIRPPAADVITLKDALNSPVKTRVSVQGKIIQEDALQEVSVKHTKVKVKTIHIKDASSKAKVSLWRGATDSTVRAGDYVKITNVIINSFRNEISLSTTSLTQIEVTEAPEEETTVNIMGACVEGQMINFLMEDDTDLQVPLELIPVTDIDDLESFFLQKCNPMFALKITYKGADIISVEFK